MGVTQKEWEQYLAELESLEKRYFAERDVVRDKLVKKQKRLRKSKESKMATESTITDKLKKRLGVVGEFIGQDPTQDVLSPKKYWVTDRGFLIDPDIAGTPVPDILIQLIHLTKTPLDMIYRIQQGLGVYDEKGNQVPYKIPFNEPKPEGYQLFRDALNWLGCNYPDVGGWFYAVDTIHRANKSKEG